MLGAEFQSHIGPFLAELAEKDIAWKGTDEFPIFASALKLQMEVVTQHNLCEVQNIELQGSRQTGQQ